MAKFSIKILISFSILFILFISVSSVRLSRRFDPLEHTLNRIESDPRYRKVWISGQFPHYKNSIVDNSPPQKLSVLELPPPVPPVPKDVVQRELQEAASKGNLVETIHRMADEEEGEEKLRLKFPKRQELPDFDPDIAHPLQIEAAKTREKVKELAETADKADRAEERMLFNTLRESTSRDKFEKKKLREEKVTNVRDQFEENERLRKAEIEEQRGELDDIMAAKAQEATIARATNTMGNRNSAELSAFLNAQLADVQKDIQTREKILNL